MIAPIPPHKKTEISHENRKQGKVKNMTVSARKLTSYRDKNNMKKAKLEQDKN